MSDLRGADRHDVLSEVDGQYVLTPVAAAAPMAVAALAWPAEAEARPGIE